MFKITYLLDHPHPTDEPFHFVFNHWIAGLLESQHEVEVITGRSHWPAPNHQHSRLHWRQTLTDASLKDILRIAPLLWQSRPKVLHILTSRRRQPWHLTTALPAVIDPLGSIPLFVSGGTDFSSKDWPFAQVVQPSSKGGPPVSDHKPFGARVFVPGPLSSWIDRISSFTQLIQRAEDHPTCELTIAWDWSDWPLRERRRMRELWLQSPARARIRAIGHLSLEDQIKFIENDKDDGFSVFADVLHPESWSKEVLSPPVAPWRLLDANGLARKYRELSIRA